MGSRNTHKPHRHGGHPALLKPNAAGCDTQSGAGCQNGDAGTIPAGLSVRLAGELFARLLLELPEHRRDLQSAYQDGSTEQLERSAHKLLGAVVYCELPELADALRELKQASKTRNGGLTGPAFGRTLRLIDELLACSGYSEP